jgi:hypothetical protein
MGEEVRVWQVGADDQLTEVGRSKLDLEERIEKWLAQDISVLDPNLLVIGQQVETAFGKLIDLLCMDATGNLVIVELKRDKTPRDVTAQAIDYASWVKDLEAEDIQLIAGEYFKKKGTNLTLEAAFGAKFKTDFPEVINEHHAMRVVASEIDDSTERIIRYLSETYGVDINAARFHFFTAAGGGQLLVRTFTVALEQAETNITKGPGKRRPPATPEEMEQGAKDAGVLDLYQRFRQALAPYFGAGKTTRSTLSFDAKFADDSRKVVWALVPGESSAAEGLRYHLYSQRLAEFIHVGEDVVAAHLPPNRQPWDPWPGMKGLAGYIKTENDIQKIADLLNKSMEGEATS